MLATTSTEVDLLHFLAFLPIIWTALSFLFLAIRIVAKRIVRFKHAYTIPTEKEDENSGNWFDVFIQEDDILSVLPTDDSYDANLEELLPAPSSGLKILPALETMIWTLSACWLWEGGGTQRSSRVDRETIIAMCGAVSWGYALALSMNRRTRLPAYQLLILAFLHLVNAVVSLVQLLHSHEFPLLAIPAINFAICTTLVILIVRMPLKIPINRLLLSRKTAAPESPEDENSLFGSLNYSWMGSLMQIETIEKKDVFQLSLDNRSAVLTRRFEKLGEGSLLRRMLLASTRDIVIDFTLKLVAVCFDFARPLMIQRLLECIAVSSITLSLTRDEKEWTPREQAYIFGILATLSMVFRSLSEVQHFHHARRIGMRLRTELTTAIFDKALRRKDMAGKVDSDQARNSSVGRVLNLLSADVNRVLRMGCDSHLIYGSPLQITLGLTLLYRLLGNSAFVGLSVLVVAIPVNYLIGLQSIQISKGRSVARDKRLSKTHELTTSIRTIKMFGWSSKWIAQVSKSRDEELRWMVKEWTNRLFLTLLWSIVGVGVPLSSFYCYTVVFGHELTVAIAFTALSLFTMIRAPLTEIPEFGIRLLHTLVSVNRLSEFLEEEEVVLHIPSPPRSRLISSDEGEIGFDKASFCWTSTTPTWTTPSWTLGDLSIRFPKSELSVISGHTASGKSSLLLALLGEMTTISGSITRPRKVSYAAQSPWLESSTIRSSILYGSPLLPTRYQSVLHLCALTQDISSWKEGDLTQIGSKGLQLSGGQRARVALARAVYAQNDVVLLDDVLSAVDVTTATFLVGGLFGGGNELMRGRTVILCSHHTALILPVASYHVELEQGRVVRQGAVERTRRESDFVAVESSGLAAMDVAEVEDVGVPVFTAETVSTEEGWNSGAVKLSTFTKYLRTSSYLGWILLAGLMLLKPLLAYSEAYWLQLWASSTDPSSSTTVHFISIYAAIGLASISTTLISTVVLYYSSLRASRALFRQLVEKVVGATMRWHDVVESGRVVARFTNDMGIIDEALSVDFNQFGSNIVSLLSYFLINSFILPAALVPTLFCLSIYAYIFVRYLKVSRELNRISSTTTAPIFSGFEQVLVGITTVRAFGRQDDYREALFELLDSSQALWYTLCTIAVWLSLRTQLLAALCLLFTAILGIYSEIETGYLGIALSFAQLILTVCSSACESYSRLVLDGDAMERVEDYLDLPQERTDGILPPAWWPSETASIVVENLVIQYASELPIVLKGISFTVKGSERIAIVGRTGSGKSTLAMSLLRFVDPISGSIRIDGLDISKIDLETLRQRISIIPQDAILFSGTIRQNIDPDDIYSDEQCQDALRRVQLSNGDVDSITLGTEISQGGHSLSIGQRQLCALARALLRDTRIIILDEATSSIDFATDSIIQKTIRTEFQNSTILTIAHRLDTIIDYDRILVLENGEIVEFDSPKELLAKRGRFYEMVQESGLKME